MPTNMKWSPNNPDADLSNNHVDELPTDNTVIKSKDVSSTGVTLEDILEVIMTPNKMETDVEPTHYGWVPHSLPINESNIDPISLDSNSSHDNSSDFNDNLNAELDCRTFLFVVYVVIFGTMCVFGLIGNTLSFLVLQWEKHGHVATFLLQVMALLDNLFLLTTGFSQIYSAVVTFTNWTADPVQPFIRMLVWPLVHVTQLGTVWITVLIAFNRYIAICKPFRAPMLCTMGKVRLQVAIMVVFCILYCIPRFFEYRVGYFFNSETNTTQPETIVMPLLSNKTYNYVYENGLYTLIVFLAPLVILIILNACLMQELWRARQRALQRQLPAFMTAEDQENNLTLVMIIIILIFVMCQTPALINNLLFVIDGDEYMCGKPYFYYFHISNLLISANSSVNFVVYCIFRKQFRERLKAFCGKDRESLKQTETYTTSIDGRTASVYSKNSLNPTPL